MRALPLAHPSTNDINSTLLACLYARFYALFSGINVAMFPVLIRLFTRLPPGSRRIRNRESMHDCRKPTPARFPAELFNAPVDSTPVGSKPCEGYPKTCLGRFYDRNLTNLLKVAGLNPGQHEHPGSWSQTY